MFFCFDDVSPGSESAAAAVPSQGGSVRAKAKAGAKGKAKAKARAQPQNQQTPIEMKESTRTLS